MGTTYVVPPTQHLEPKNSQKARATRLYFVFLRVTDIYYSLVTVHKPRWGVGRRRREPRGGRMETAPGPSALAPARPACPLFNAV